MKKAARNISSLLLALMIASPDSNQDNNVLVVGATPITVSRGTWYEAPWVWVVGPAVFVLVLVMVDKARRRSRRTH
jgi:hypothetical protein